MRAHTGSAFLVLTLTWTGAASGAEVLQSDIVHADNRYTVRFDVRLDAPAEKLRRHLLDYPNYATHFKSIRESRVLGRQPDGALRVRLRIHGCALFFCRTVTVVKDISETPAGDIVARVDGSQSSFREGTERWRIDTEVGALVGRTRLTYDAELVPGFYVPPVIGPWLLKAQLRKLLMNSAVKLEALAREH
jgi:hypothetical protein